MVSKLYLVGTKGPKAWQENIPHAIIPPWQASWMHTFMFMPNSDAAMQMLQQKLTQTRQHFLAHVHVLVVVCFPLYSQQEWHPVWSSSFLKLLKRKLQFGNAFKLLWTCNICGSASNLHYNADGISKLQARCIRLLCERRLVSVNCIQQLGFVSILKDIYSFIKIQNITRETAFNKFLFHENPTQEIKV